MRPLGWRLRRSIPPGQTPWRGLERAWGLTPETARLAWLRGIDNPEDLVYRLDPSWERTLDPYLMDGMGAAVARIRQAIQAKERIGVYGDYDVDGVTATALLVRVLERIGATVDYFIPNRFNDGYGLHLECIQELYDRWGPGLMISVDCGIRSISEVEASRELGLDWIITDHHVMGEAVPGACAVVHPSIGDYPNRHLSGVGVAFKLAQALLDAVPFPSGAEGTFLDGLLKLVALGTLADMVPLVGENAVLVKRGMNALAGSNAPGLAALLNCAKIEGQPDSQKLAFGVIPRLNAVGRMDGADDAVRMLLTRDSKEAAELAHRVEQLNEKRKLVQQDLVERLPIPKELAFDLVVDADAHKGVIGIVAGQRMRQSGLPTGVCTVQEGVIQCSLRAPEGYDLALLLDRARPFLLGGGGHKSAAGMTFQSSRLPFVQEVFHRAAAEQKATAIEPSISVDGEGIAWIPEEASLRCLEPFGQGFPEAQVVLEGSLLSRPRPFGKGHCSLKLEGLEKELTWFFGMPRAEEMRLGEHARFAVSAQDHPRWGRSWNIKAEVGDEVRP